MRLVLFGAPGSGKGTQAALLARHYGVAHVAAGDRLRAEVASGSTLGAQLAGYLRAGDLVPDDLVLAILWDSIAAAAAAGGYVLDGFPRTLAQAQETETRGVADGVTPEAAVHLVSDPESLVARMLARAEVEGRADDTEPVIRHRLAVFERETRPVIDYYGARGILARVDATGSVDDVFATTLRALGE